MQLSKAMDDATEERLRLDALHHEELLRIAKTQEQERKHREWMLDHEHQAVHNAALNSQKAPNAQDYEHRKRTLKLERQYALTGPTLEPRKSVTEPESAVLSNGAVVESGDQVLGSKGSDSENKAMFESEERFTESKNAESLNSLKKEGRSKAQIFMGFAENAAQRAAKKTSKRGTEKMR